MNDRQLLVLVVEPERPLAGLFQLDLTARGHRVNVVHSAEHALEVLTPHYDVVVTALRLPIMTGEEFIVEMRSRPGYDALPVLVIAREEVLPESIQNEATYLRRIPFDLDHFTRYVTEAAGAKRFAN